MRRMTACLALLFCLAASGQDFSKYLSQVDEYPFIVISKTELTLDLVDARGNSIVHYGCACAKNYGPKEKKGDHKTPEGVFKITQLLNARGLSHDFGDGKGPVRDAYGPWFLRLGVPGFIDIGIHGTHLPESIGTRATEGCIRLKNEDIVDLKQRVHVGTPVIILPDAQ
ncbi:MAG: L,D-transpeptidase [Bacteroidales bacterium]|nr:L,D-transpeptidase [Candidatus Cryptobacteroides choladohippi]